MTDNIGGPRYGYAPTAAFAATRVDELYGRVVGAGYEGKKEPWDAEWGQRYAMLGDPDGVRVNLYARLA